MDPYTANTSPMQSVFTSVPFGNNIFLASVFVNEEDQNSYLSSLDSDTREYVLRHKDEFRTRQDIVDFVGRMRNS